jgi:hypothetical protein
MIKDMVIKEKFKKEDGYFFLGHLMTAFFILGVLMLLTEMYRIYTIKQNVDIELSRAVNIALDLSMMDIYRRDHALELDPGIARASFYSYLHDDLKLDGSLSYRDSSGREIFSLDIQDLIIQASPPVIKLNAGIEFKPSYFGNFYLTYIRLPVRAASQNKRIQL